MSSTAGVEGSSIGGGREGGDHRCALCMLWPSSIYERLMTTGRLASKSLPSDGGGDKRPSYTEIETMTSTNPSLI